MKKNAMLFCCFFVLFCATFVQAGYSGVNSLLACESISADWRAVGERYNFDNKEAFFVFFKVDRVSGSGSIVFNWQPPHGDSVECVIEYDVPAGKTWANVSKWYSFENLVNGEHEFSINGQSVFVTINGKNFNHSLVFSYGTYPEGHIKEWQPSRVNSLAIFEVGIPIFATVAFSDIYKPVNFRLSWILNGVIHYGDWVNWLHPFTYAWTDGVSYSNIFNSIPPFGVNQVLLEVEDMDGARLLYRSYEFEVTDEAPPYAGPLNIQGPLIIMDKGLVIQ